jgi:hypothetical protein
MAHVFQGCAAFGTDKGLNAAAGGNSAHNAVASSRLLRGTDSRPPRRSLSWGETVQNLGVLRSAWSGNRGAG